MKKLLYIMPLMLLWSACGSTTTSGKESETQNQSQAAPEAVPDSSARQAKTDTTKKAALTYPRNLFTELEAGGILGEAVHLKDSSCNMSIATKEYKCSFVGNAADPKSGNTSAIYFMIEDYLQADAAHNEYASIKKANEKGGIRELKGVGDEGYMQIDGNKLWFILVRKGKRMFRIKVNKMTMSASIIQFTSVSKKITESI